MKKVTPEARLGQGSDLLCARAAHPSDQAATSLLRGQSAPVLRPSPHLALAPRAGQGWEEAVLRSLSRRAARAVRPFVQSAPRHELWLMGFDQDCGQVGLQRLVPGEQGQPFTSLLTVITCAAGMGARAIVLVQNRPGPLRLSTPVDTAPTRKLAAMAHIAGITLVDHLLLFSGGRAPRSLWQQHSSPEAKALAAQLETTLA